MGLFFLTLALMILMILIGAPIAFSVGISGVIYILITDPHNITEVPIRMFTGVNSFVLMALPFFMFAAELMIRSGISKKLFDFIKLFFGRIRGGLAIVNVLASTVFGGISGAALADVASLGKIEIDAMLEDGYDKHFTCAITAASSLQSPLIPPSNLGLLYAGVMSLSVGAVLMGGLVPGLLLGGSQILYIVLMGKKLSFPKHTEKYSRAEIKRIIKDGLIAIVMPLIVLGGIVFGIVTPTEAAGLAVAYALVVGLLVFGNLKMKDIVESLWAASRSTANLFLIISFSSIFAWVMGMQNIPGKLATYLLSVVPNPYTLLLLVNIFLIIVGMLMESGAAVVLFAPVLAPIMYKVGINPIQFAIVMIVNLTLGLITPPVGMVLFATCTVGKEKFEDLVKAIIPFIIVGFVVLALVTYFPGISLFMPRILHLL